MSIRMGQYNPQYVTMTITMKNKRNFLFWSIHDVSITCKNIRTYNKSDQGEPKSTTQTAWCCSSQRFEQLWFFFSFRFRFCVFFFFVSFCFLNAAQPWNTFIIMSPFIIHTHVSTVYRCHVHIITCSQINTIFNISFCCGYFRQTAYRYLWMLWIPSILVRK